MASHVLLRAILKVLSPFWQPSFAEDTDSQKLDAQRTKATVTPDFDGTPPVPQEVPTVPLKCLSLASLLSPDPSTAENESLFLIKTCKLVGFFCFDF